MKTHFLRMARYHVWATRRLLGAVAAVSDADHHRDVGLFFKSIHGTQNHLLLAEHRLWFPRFAHGDSPRLALDTEIESDRQALAQALLQAAQAWEPLISAWSEERFDGLLHYHTSKGLPQSLPFAATLAHVFNHGTHHRGQITAALTHMGYGCPELDLVYCLQEEASR